MTTFHRTSDEFTLVPKAVFTDNRLSAAAMGVYGFLTTCPDGFDIEPEAIARHMQDGTEVIAAALEELHRCGHFAEDESETGR